MLGENLQTVRENAEIFTKASKNIGLEVNTEKTKNTMHVIQNQNIVIGNLSFENVEKLSRSNSNKYPLFRPLHFPMLSIKGITWVRHKEGVAFYSLVLPVSGLSLEVGLGGGEHMTKWRCVWTRTGQFKYL